MHHILLTIILYLFLCDDKTYQWPWSMYCRSSSMGGWAPYTSFAGMLRSSTKMTAFLPICGPNTPFLLLSSLDMIMFCRKNFIHMHQYAQKATQKLLQPEVSVRCQTAWAFIIRGFISMINNVKIEKNCPNILHVKANVDANTGGIVITLLHWSAVTLKMQSYMYNIFSFSKMLFLEENTDKILCCYIKTWEFFFLCTVPVFGWHWSEPRSWRRPVGICLSPVRSSFYPVRRHSSLYR